MPKLIEQTNLIKLCAGIAIEYYYCESDKLYTYSHNDNTWSLRIDHCMLGGISVVFSNGQSAYLVSGQYAINSPDSNLVTSHFPDKYYEGISIFITTKLLTPDMQQSLPFWRRT